MKRRKLTFTRREAISITKQLWKWLAETGGLKVDWPGFEDYPNMVNHCPLCQYAFDKHGKTQVPADKQVCKVCPYQQTFGVWCIELEDPYHLFCNAKCQEDCQRYAELFLEKMRQVK